MFELLRLEQDLPFTASDDDLPSTATSDGVIGDVAALDTALGEIASRLERRIDDLLQARPKSPNGRKNSRAPKPNGRSRAPNRKRNVCQGPNKAPSAPTVPIDGHRGMPADHMLARWMKGQGGSTAGAYDA